MATPPRSAALRAGEGARQLPDRRAGPGDDDVHPCVERYRLPMRSLRRPMGETRTGRTCSRPSVGGLGWASDAAFVRCSHERGIRPSWPLPPRRLAPPRRRPRRRRSASSALRPRAAAASPTFDTPAHRVRPRHRPRHSRRVGRSDAQRPVDPRCPGRPDDGVEHRLDRRQHRVRRVHAGPSGAGNRVVEHARGRDVLAGRAAGERRLLGGGRPSTGGTAYYALDVWIDAAVRQNIGLLQRLSFAPGTDSGTVGGSVLLGATDRWYLTASAGQLMDVSVTSVEGNSTFDVFAPDGTAMTAPAERTTWSGPLPQNGGYRIDVSPTRGNATYTMTVRITGGTPSPQQTPQQTPHRRHSSRAAGQSVQRVNFAPGADHVEIRDSITPDVTHTFDPRCGGAASVMTVADRLRRRRHHHLGGSTRPASRCGSTSTRSPSTGSARAATTRWS